jgi:hypothetical protein
MSLMHIFSPNEQFPAYNDVNRALHTPSASRTQKQKETIRQAYLHFHVCPGSLDVLPPGFLDQIDSMFENVFEIRRTGPYGDDWPMETYCTEICDLLNQSVARPGLTKFPIPKRAPARMCYYLHRVCGGMYILMATMVVKTSEWLLGASLVICKVSGGDFL